MADALDILRDDAISRRVKGSMSGGNRILWSAKDIAAIRIHIAEMLRKFEQGAS
jgi:hypothetical protein